MTPHAVALLANACATCPDRAASGDRLRDRVDIDANFAQLDEAANPGFLARLAHITSPRVSLAFRVQELGRAGPDDEVLIGTFLAVRASIHLATDHAATSACR